MCCGGDSLGAEGPTSLGPRHAAINTWPPSGGAARMRTTGAALAIAFQTARLWGSSRDGLAKRVSAWDVRVQQQQLVRSVARARTESRRASRASHERSQRLREAAVALGLPSSAAGGPPATRLLRPPTIPLIRVMVRMGGLGCLNQVTAGMCICKIRSAQTRAVRDQLELGGDRGA